MTTVDEAWELRQIVDLIAVNVEGEILPRLDRMETMLKEHTAVLEEHTRILQVLSMAIVTLGDDMKLVKAHLGIV